MEELNESEAPSPIEPTTVLTSRNLQTPCKGRHRLEVPDMNLPFTIEGYIWSMDWVLNLETTWAGAYQPEKVRVEDVLPMIKQEIAAYPKMYDLLTASMQDYGQRMPIRVTQDMTKLRDGMHRIAIADLLGWKTMIVDTTHTAWHEWNESETGQLYMSMWRQKLGYFRR